VKYEGTIQLETRRLNLGDDIKRELVTCDVDTVMNMGFKKSELVFR
jgi:hypothetical protein